MIDKQPLELFGGDDDEAQRSEAASVWSAPDPSAGTGFWLCQRCGATIPFGATACTECSGSDDDHHRAHHPESELLRFFTESSMLETLGILHDLGGTADQRATYQEYFRESLRRQTAEAALPPLPVEEPRLICRWCNTPHDDGQPFCTNCGTRLPSRAMPEATTAPVLCQWCQASIEPGTTVCPACNGSIGDPERTVSGLTDLSSVEIAAEYAFKQGVPIRCLQIGVGADLYRANRFWKSLFGKPK